MDSTEDIQFVFNEEGKKTFALLPIDIFQKMSEVYEELEDIKAYDKAKKENNETISLDDMLMEVEKERDDL